jgi:hypothetical protein
MEGKSAAIAPRMQVNAEIVMGNRRVIKYVLSPALPDGHASGRER